MENGRCRMHGGTSLSGMQSGTFKTGRYSKDLPTRLASKYQEAVSDGELLALREDVALVDARLSDVLGRADTGEAGRHWHRLSDLWHIAETGDQADKVDAINEIGRTIKRGVSDYAVWDEVGKLLEQRRRLVESERKRLVDMQQMITTERAMLLLSATVDIIRRHVTDRDTMSAINAEFRTLLLAGADSGNRPGA